MKTPFFSLPRHLLLHLVSTFCIGIGCAWPLALALHLFDPLPVCLAASCGAAFVFALLDCMPRLRTLCILIIPAAAAAIAFAMKDHVQAVSAALTLFLNGQPLALAAYSRAAAILLSLLTTCIGASLARSENAFFPLALLTISVLIAISFLGIDVSALSLLPLAAALLIAARVPGVGSRSIVPAAALALLLPLLLSPLSGSVSPRLSGYAEKIRQKIDDYLFFTDPRTAFSLSAVGWQPFGVHRLGGPVNPTSDPVMQVETPGRALLRGTVKNEYTGLSWADTTSGRRYLFVSPRFMRLRRDLFDLSRPEKRVLKALPESQTIHVTMASDAASTLYLTQRFLSARGENIVPYFSPASEVFATRSLAPGDSYAFSGRLMTASDEGVREAVLLAHDPSDPHYESVRNTYLQLPASVDPRVYALAAQLTADAQSDYDRAAELCLYLQTSFPYTLNQSVPPPTQDFVFWFLFEEQQGYCTSFASSLCVLARAAGLPSRYIEGYAAIPDADGIARVTQQYAHAWSEIYFPGFGWLTFDPTPGSGSGADGTGGGLPDMPPDTGSDPGNPPDGGSGENDGAQDGQTPSPTPSPAPSPSPTPQHNDPHITPTPEITPVPTPVPTPTPPRQMRDRDDSPPYALFLLLLLFLLAALIALRLALAAPARAAQRCRNPRSALLIWYHAVSEALLCMGIAPAPSEAPATFLTRAQHTLGDSVRLAHLMHCVCIARYSSHRLKSTHVSKAQKTYRSLFAMLTPAQKLRLFARRLIYGSKPD